MDADMQPEIDWVDWLKRWDAQQEGYVSQRETCFAAMFDALAELLPTPFVAVDLACGPGSISQRLLARFSDAHAIAVDMDPVMLAIGRGAIGTVAGRLHWIEADLTLPDWLEALNETQVDAVLTATALHWLEPESLARLYRDLSRLVRPGGLFLNCDTMAFGPTSPNLDRLSQRALDDRWSDAAFAASGIETAEQWWDALAAEPAFEQLRTEQARAFSDKKRPESTLGFDGHIAALQDAGFREVGTIWQMLSNRVLLAVHE
jgi:SAM-dependent methyltransferase